MNLLAAWQESLQLFIPKNFKLFLLVTLKAMVETYKTLITKFWWLILLCVGFDFLLDYVPAKFDGLLIAVGAIFTEFDFISPLTDLAFLALTFLIFLAVRPSTAFKNAAYVRHYLKYWLYFIAFNVIFTLISTSRFDLEVDEVADIAYVVQPAFDWLRGLLLLSPMVVVTPLFVFLMAFILDSRNGVKDVVLSVVRAVKMCVYNYPFCLISFIVFYYVSMGFDQVIFYSMRLMNVPVIGITDQSSYVMLPALKLLQYGSLLLLPIPVSYFYNFYTKRLHEQFTLYFKVNS